MENIILHRSDSRGIANLGWLNSRHTFSFANYYNPERMHFGALRVLNDDIVAEGMGFSKHPHENMEIISIPLEGDLEHKDSMGNTTVIKKGDIQIMSAGTGIVHSEYNKNKYKKVKFLQIWLFPKLTFKSSKIESKGGNDYLLTGDLTIKETTKAVTLDIEYSGLMKDPWGNTKIAISLNGKINRKDFGLAWNAALETGGVLVGEEIKLNAEVQLVMQ